MLSAGHYPASKATLIPGYPALDPGCFRTNFGQQPDIDVVTGEEGVVARAPSGVHIPSTNPDHRWQWFRCMLTTFMSSSMVPLAKLTANRGRKQMMGSDPALNTSDRRRLYQARKITLQPKCLKSRRHGIGWTALFGFMCLQRAFFQGRQFRF